MLSRMLNRRLEVDHESTMAFELLKFIKSQICSLRSTVFTTNHVEKLDHALIRRGRMDKHIELGYCSFDAFKVLENNYLYLKSHVLFDKIHFMLEEVDMTPPDVAENLMPKTSPGDPEGCLSSLIRALEAVKPKKIEEEEEKKSRDIEECTRREE
ncbi:AAA-ATPase ASD, mitochondrial-like protein [Tanacetum coccineum]